MSVVLCFGILISCVNVTLADASKDSRAYGDEAVLNTIIKDTTDTIRVFYMNKHTLAPLFGTYDIK